MLFDDFRQAERAGHDGRRREDVSPIGPRRRLGGLVHDSQPE
jgi:hypothetical protein